MKMTKRKKTIIALIIGFAFAMILMAVLIYFGYSQAYQSEAELLSVKLFGLPIYELSQNGSKYVGRALGPNMGIVCLVCMLLSVIVTELIGRIRGR